MPRNQSRNYGRWTNMLKRLQVYQQEHDGSCDVPQQYPPDPKLGRWVMDQRSGYKRGLLEKERCDQLEAIGFEFTRTRRNYQKCHRDKWTKMFKRLQAYQQEHNGSCNVPRKYGTDPQLSTWVKNQRHRYIKGSLAKEKSDQLTAIGFEWTRNPTWTEMFKRLQAYQQEHSGSCNLPTRYYPDLNLGRWVQKQRSKYKKGLLAKERFDQLEAIGFQWTSTNANHKKYYQDRWTEMLKRLQAYQQEHNGSCNVPARYPQEPRLGAWVAKQRSLNKKGLLAKERCDQLEAIGFRWRLRGVQVSKLSEVSKAKQPDPQESLRWCWV